MFIRIINFKTFLYHERKQQLLKDHQKIIQERESAKKLKLEKKEKENNKMRENMAKIGRKITK
jgi:hypothetical protein